MDLSNPITELVGKKIKKIMVFVDSVTVKTQDNEVYCFYHAQDCCELCEFVALQGRISDVVDEEIISADEIITRDFLYPTDYDSGTETTFTIHTSKGTIALIFIVTSNGYYSEGIKFDKVVGTKPC